MNQKKVQSIVEKVIAQVRKNGDKAVIDITRKIDKVRLTPKTLRIPKSKIDRAYRDLEVGKRKALESCARRIQEFHFYESKNLPKSWTVNKNGVRLGQIYSVIESVGIYVPGGRFSYPSTLLMTAIPASLAGVRKKVVVTPPGRLTNEILAAAKIAGVDELFQVGGPASLAALAIGTKSIPKVDLIIGPGNALVTEAKRQLFGEVGIDLLAGPSELVVLADDSAPPRFIAADMAAQAEHDPDAMSALITTSSSLIKQVKKHVPKPVAKQCKYFKESSVNKAVDRANVIAGEHVQLMVKKPQEYMDRLKNGGAFFINPWSPAVMGDYWAGPSHVLPTGASARFGSGLSVMSFLKRSSLIEVSSGAFKKGAPAAIQVAETEGLFNHANSLKVRGK